MSGPSLVILYRRSRWFLLVIYNDNLIETVVTIWFLEGLRRPKEAQIEAELCGSDMDKLIFAILHRQSRCFFFTSNTLYSRGSSTKFVILYVLNLLVSFK